MVDEHRGDMDAKAARYIWECVRWACTIVPCVLYLEGRFTKLEERFLLLEERAGVNASRIDRLESASMSRLAVGADGGFANEAVRGLILTTLRIEAERLGLAFRAEIERQFQSFAEHNNLKR